MHRIVSSVPGRLRLRDAALRDPLRLERLEQVIGAVPHVTGTRRNVPAGSLVVHYDAVRLAPAELEAQVLAALKAELAGGPGERGRSGRVKLNRVAKHAMLGSLGASLLLAAAGYKRWHVLSGGCFVASLAVHLAVHRRHLLR